MSNRIMQRRTGRRRIEHDSVWTTFRRDLANEAVIRQPIASGENNLDAAGKSVPEGISSNDARANDLLAAIESGSWWVSDAESGT